MKTEPCPYCGAPQGVRARGRECTACGAYYVVRSSAWLFHPPLFTVWQAEMWEVLRRHAWSMLERSALRAASRAHAANPARFVEAILDHLPPPLRSHLLGMVDPSLGVASVRMERAAELEQLAAAGFPAVEVLGTTDDRTCPACRAHHGRVYAIAEALRLHPLPCEGCTCLETSDGARPFCLCLWVTAHEPANVRRGLLGVAHR